MKGFVVYKSSAGSGKTFTLVREYLAIVLREPDKFRHVLAVTFTNKAASEMKERVVQYLTGLSDPGSAKDDKTIPILKDQLLRETGLDETELQKRSGWVLKQLMHHYTEFAVGTIDSFMHRVVRAFAFDLGIPVNFEVEIDEDELLTQAVDVLVSRAGIDKELTATLVSFVESKTAEEKSWDVERDLLDISHHLFKEDARPFLKRLEGLSMEDFSRIKSSLYRYLKNYEKDLLGEASKAMALISSAGLDVGSFKGKNSGIGGYFRKILDGRFDELEPSNTLAEMVASGELTAKTAPEHVKAAVETIKSDLLGIFNKIQDIREKNEGWYLILGRVLDNIHQLALLGELARIIDDFRKDESIVHISEFNRRIYDFVIREPVPFIYERLGEKFRHYLIDEFQDTSLQQWHNLLPLVENALAYANYNMVVGDGKQAIYRFRAGDVEQFTKLPGIVGADNEILKQREKTLTGNFESRNLEVNYRSKAEIVRFNNELFSEVATWLKDDLRDIYHDILQKEGKKEGGYVRLDFIDSKEEYQDLQLQNVVNQVRECTDDGYSWSDIAVLCRENQKASLVARHLLSQGIDVISSESLLVGSAGSVVFVTSFLKVLYRPEELTSYISILKVLEQKGMIEQEDLLSLLTVIREQKGSPDRWQMSRDEAFRILENKNMRPDTRYLLSLDLYELVEEIARHYGILDHRDPYIISFMDIVREQAGRGRSDPDDFLKWWEENRGKLSVVVPEGINAVRIMTIHKAKGLQFPVVIYPFADQEKRLTKKELWIDVKHPAAQGLPVALVKATREMLNTPYSDRYEDEDARSFVDLVNLLYVALTRPKERLYVISRYYNDPGKLNTVGKILRKWLEVRDSWKDDKLTYTFGNRSKVTGQKEEAPGAVLQCMVSEPWGDRFLIRMNAPFYWDIEDPERNRKWGNMIHLVFSRISGQADVEKIAGELAAEGALSDSDRHGIVAVVKEVIENPEIKPYFDTDYEVLNEAEIITEEGQIYRPDRLLIKNKSAIVIDFKTGSHRDAYKEQLETYSQALEKMGFKVDERVLIYVGKKTSVTRW